MNYSQENSAVEINGMSVEEEDGPFDEVDDMLCSEERDFEQDQNENQWMAKIGELEQLCEKLSATNEQLQQRIEELEGQLECRNANQTQFTDEYSQMQCDFNDIEDIIKSYRNDLKQYQAGVEEETKRRENTIAQMQQQIQELGESNFQLQEMVAGLQQNNQDLLLEIEQLQSHNRKSTSRQSPRFSQRQSDFSTDFSSSDYYQQSNGDFNSNVHEELQRLIEKLMRELEHERASKRKLTDELKRSQRQILGYEKEIMKKNSKIYQLEMHALKKEGGLNSSKQLINGYDR